MNKIVYLVISLSSLLFIKCDNNTKVDQSKLENNKESEIIKNEKILHEKQIDNLSYEINKIKEEKSDKEHNIKFSEAEIYNLLKSSYFDHLIIGSKDLSNSELFLKETLGFNIKKGRKHMNGITNLYVEFQDSSEIEFMSVKNPKDKMANIYNSLLNKNQYGFQFAIRTNSLDLLAENFNELKSEYSVLSKNDDYKILSNKTFSEKFPLFFIQYSSNSNNLTSHNNNTSGISAIWLSTPNIRKSIEQYSNFGFTLIDTLTVANIKSKTALMKNNNFEIIFISNKDYSISGITIKTDDVRILKDNLNSRLNLNLDTKFSKRGKSVYLSPKITNSIWFEFLEN